MEYILFIYPIAHKHLSLIQTCLNEFGSIERQKTIQLTYERALGFIAQMYWNPSNMSLEGFQNKTIKGGWTEKTTEPLTILTWKSPEWGTFLSGTGAPLKCYLRQIAFTGNHFLTPKIFLQKWKPSDEECKQWKAMLHSPDSSLDWIRLYPMCFHDSTVEFMKQVQWKQVLPLLLKQWTFEPKNKNTEMEWSVFGQLQPMKQPLTKEWPPNGVFWFGYWMSQPPITPDEWKIWIESSRSQKTNKLWIHPATMTHVDLKVISPHDYFMSWKADGIHIILNIDSNGVVQLLNEQNHAIITDKTTKLKSTRWEGEWIAEQGEVWAFDFILPKLNYKERMEQGITYWKPKQQKQFLWDGIKISSTITLRWKPSNLVTQIKQYLLDLEKTKLPWDGLIFTHSEQPTQILKWKPIFKQTVDVYIYQGKPWLKQFMKHGSALCPHKQKGYYPRLWNYSEVSKQEPNIFWDDKTTIINHNEEIWEVQWKQNRWVAMKRRQENKEPQLLESGGRCGRKFMGPNAWLTMKGVEQAILNEITPNDLETWSQK